MRELSIMEVESVSGAGFFSRIGASVLGSIALTTVGLAKGGVSGGSTGGLLGIGSIAALVTMIVGGVAGAVQGAVYGFVNDWDKTLEYFNNSSEQWADLSLSTPKV